LLGPEHHAVPGRVVLLASMYVTDQYVRVATPKQREIDARGYYPVVI
jgi:hypothetical protein